MKSKETLKFLQTNKDLGGVCLFNLENKKKALKIQWINTISTDIEILTLAKQFFTGKSDYILHANLKEQDVHLFVKNVFWRDVIETWAVYTYCQVFDSYVR